jgi:hypothetical protein
MDELTHGVFVGKWLILKNRLMFCGEQPAMKSQRKGVDVRVGRWPGGRSQTD